MAYSKQLVLQKLNDRLFTHQKEMVNCLLVGKITEAKNQYFIAKEYVQLMYETCLITAEDRDGAIAELIAEYIETMKECKK